jgi:hypothetical protein
VVGSAATGSSGGALALNGLFPIGVFQQPVSNFAGWKARGINTVTVIPADTDLDAWAQAADQAGLYQIRGPRPDTATDLADKWLLALNQTDEPDGINSQVPASQLQKIYTAWKTTMPERSVYINLVGALNQYDISGACADKTYRDSCPSGDSWYAHYVAAADWISGDRYPVNSGEPLAEIGSMVDHLRQLAGDKPTFAFIETGDYDTTDRNPGPTADQLRDEVWSAIIHGVRGIWYFPERVTPTFDYDVTPDPVAAELTRQDALITKLSAVLQTTIDPGGLSAKPPSSLEAGWRSVPGAKYVFVLNQTDRTVDNQFIKLTGVGNATQASVYDENRAVDISRGGITDSFAPYAVHIYQIP